MTIKGAMVAAAVAGMFASATPLVASAADTGAKTGRCDGGNACKGKSACATAKNGCSGQNACKGQGWVTVSEDDCKKAGGKFKAK